jgi:hypothetical protein
MWTQPPTADRTAYTDELFRDLHKAEFERKDKHDSVDSFLLAATTVLGGVAVYYSRILPSATGTWGTIFVVLFWAFVVTFVGALFSLTRSVWPRFQGYLADPRELYNFVSGLRAHYEFSEKDEDKLEAAIETDLRRIIRPMCVDAASQNRYINKQKLSWQTRAKICLISGVYIFLANAAPAYFVQRAHVEATNVRVIEFLKPQLAPEEEPDGKRRSSAPNAAASDRAATEAGATQSRIPARGSSPTSPATQGGNVEKGKSSPP